MTSSSCSSYRRTKTLPERHKYHLQNNSYRTCEKILKDACVKLVPLKSFGKVNREPKVYSKKPRTTCEDTTIENGKKEIAIFLEKKNAESLPTLLQNNEPEMENVTFSSNTFLKTKKSLGDQDYEALHHHQQKPISKINLASLAENGLFLTGLKKVTDKEKGKSCNETVSNSDSSVCLSQELGVPDAFFHHASLEPVLILEKVSENEISNNFLKQNKEKVCIGNEIIKSQLTDNRTQTKNHNDNVDLKLTPPSSSIVSGGTSPSISTISEDCHAPDYYSLEDLNKQTTTGASSKCQDTSLGESLEVCIAHYEPSLYQLQHLYQRRNRPKAKRFKKLSRYRESHLRPRSSLKKFIPFMISTLPTSTRRKNGSTTNGSLKMDKLCLGDKSQVRKRRAKNRVPCQTRLFANNKQNQLIILNQKKEAIKLRNKYENALDSINKRIFRQSHFWKMLPG